MKNSLQQFALATVFLFCGSAWSQDTEPYDYTDIIESEQNVEVATPGYVEYEEPETLGDVYVESSVDSFAPYKERRGRHGVIFGIGMEKYYPQEFYSLLDDAFVDDFLDGQAIDMFRVELGYKLNFALGALTLTYSYATGSTTGSLAGSSRHVSFQRHVGAAGYYLDNILKEPWVVPYGQVGIHQISLDEEQYTAAETIAEDSVTTGFALNYKAGILIQLNWIESAIDPTTHAEGLRSSGLENTYLDISLSWYDPSQELYDPNSPIETADLDPDLRAEAQLGVGLKLEF
ncbi:MAG: hypothetical protein A2622_05090 [Bdellovibrionales bacterium RIFCSPHIGHO2_01_FULL_40_29]|nr:MAG: hypothetical protein A2622_05090 [Bdellovibrionales bacterium RIFCSPHIGHO2_01_FULL_40_29]OFZ34697.1 MAG: hypothetical protein A3D17_10280 [Bdellovibrionales bacterium RIFCSPHIGHO2_02_FULL_40_15]